MPTVVAIRALRRSEMGRVGEIDRRERIDMLVEQRGAELVDRPGRWDASPWEPTGDGEHSVAAQVRALQRYADAGGSIVGAFVDDRMRERMVGIGAIVPHLRPGVAQLAYLHVSAPRRATGIGSRLCERLEQIARDVGDASMVVSATPSENSVRFYVGRGFQPMATPFPELFDLEPDDVHLHKLLG